MKNDGRKHIIIALVYIGIITILLYFNGKGYYAAAIYPTLMAFGGVWFSRLAQGKVRIGLTWFVSIFMLGITTITLPLIVP
ncbi:hypothetical protein ABTC08_19405, partial [Acinetobacter baumannii]